MPDENYTSNHVCENCMFWGYLGGRRFDGSKFVGQGRGLCMRFPPQLVPYQALRDNPIGTNSYWPVTLDGHWCGEWKLRPVQALISHRHDKHSGRPETLEGGEKVQQMTINPDIRSGL